MLNKEVWNKEYKDGKLMTGDKPQKSFLKFMKFVKRSRRSLGLGGGLSGLRVLDLGSGNGKNASYLAERGAHVYGLEFSKEAIALSKEKVQKIEREIRVVGGKATFKELSIGGKYPFLDSYFDIILDITSSNSLTEEERGVYLKESKRVLKDNGFFFARGLLKDGDLNAKELLKKFPASEADTYIIPDFGLTERVFLEQDLKKLYSKYFKILKLQKETHYTSYSTQKETRKYKRNFWLVYLAKKS